MRVALITALLASALGSARADGDALDDMLGPRELGVGEAMRGGATGATAIGENPAGLGLNRELVFEGGYGYRASDGASLLGASACDSTAGIPGCFFYDYAASNPDSNGTSLHRTTHVGGLATSRMLTPRVLVGATFKYFHFDSDVDGEMAASGFNVDLGTTIRLSDMFNLGVAAQNLFGSSSTEFPRAVGGGILARPIPMLAMSFDMRWRLDGMQQRARYGGGVELFIRNSTGQTGVPLRAGVVRDNSLDATYLTAGIGLATMKFGFDVGARRAISGPAETVVIASMRLFGPRLPAPGVD
jgi:hypothetical protein